jgi:hypothetical protein
MCPVYRESVLIQLSLEFIPDELDLSLVRQVFPEYPNRRPIRFFSGSRENAEMITGLLLEVLLYNLTSHTIRQERAYLP